MGVSFCWCLAQVTLGPRGKNVVLWRDVGYPEVVNDGVTIARDIVLAGKPPVEACMHGREACAGWRDGVVIGKLRPLLSDWPMDVWYA